MTHSVVDTKHKVVDASHDKVLNNDSLHQTAMDERASEDRSLLTRVATRDGAAFERSTGLEHPAARPRTIRIVIPAKLFRAFIVPPWKVRVAQRLYLKVRLTVYPSFSTSENVFLNV